MSEQLERGEAAPPLAGGRIDLPIAVRFYSRLPVPALPLGAGRPCAAPISRLCACSRSRARSSGSAGAGPGAGAAPRSRPLARRRPLGRRHDAGDRSLPRGRPRRHRRTASAARRPNGGSRSCGTAAIGSFGASALVSPFALRIGASRPSRIASDSPAAAVLIAAALSRTAGLMPLALPAAGPPGRRPTRSGSRAAGTFWCAGILAAAIALARRARRPAAFGIGLMMAFSASRAAAR